METVALLKERITDNGTSKNLVIFGGSIYRRDEIVKLLIPIADLNIYATLSEEEGIAKINALSHVDIVLIGGRYTLEQRKNIKQFLSEKFPGATTTEPGVDYEYDNQLIFNNIKSLAK
jgi:CRISPR/Cas system CMR-associated protein Cmr3 (group 5 of RAMP superfamily)